MPEESDLLVLLTAAALVLIGVFLLSRRILAAVRFRNAPVARLSRNPRTRLGQRMQSAGAAHPLGYPLLCSASRLPS